MFPRNLQKLQSTPSLFALKYFSKYFYSKNFPNIILQLIKFSPEGIISYDKIAGPLAWQLVLRRVFLKKFVNNNNNNYNNNIILNFQTPCI